MNESLDYRLRAHLWALSQPRNPTLHLEAHLEARNYLREILQQQGRTVREQIFETASHGTGVNLIAAPLFVVTTNTMEREEGLAAVNAALDVVRQTIEKNGGKFDIKEEVR